MVVAPPGMKEYRAEIVERHSFKRSSASRRAGRSGRIRCITG